MPNRTLIQWCDYSSNPIKARHRETGKQGHACVRLSPGCLHCYASDLNRRLGTGLDYTVPALSQVEPYLDEKELHKMLTFRPRPTPENLYFFKNGRERPSVFVCDMTDLFGEWVPDEWIDRIFAGCALRSDVDWLILTKRAARMREYVGALSSAEIVNIWWNRFPASAFPKCRSCKEEGCDRCQEVGFIMPSPPAWPLPNVWLGTSVENQRWADIRIPELLATPAAVRFISAEPLLGPVDLTAIDKTHESDPGFSALTCGPDDEGTLGDAVLDWVIVGGESGPRARPCDIGWVRSLRDQCQAAGVPVFVKQLGRRAVTECPECGGHNLSDGYASCDCCADTGRAPYPLRDRHGGDMSEWPEDLRVREMPR